MQGDVWTIEMKDRDSAGHRAVRAAQGTSCRRRSASARSATATLQADRAEDVASEIRRALKYIPPEQLIVSSDCGFGRQGCNREIAFYKASAIAQGCNIVRQELGLPATTSRRPIPRCRWTSCRRPLRSRLRSLIPATDHADNAERVIGREPGDTPHNAAVRPKRTARSETRRVTLSADADEDDRGSCRGDAVRPRSGERRAGRRPSATGVLDAECRGRARKP